MWKPTRPCVRCSSARRSPSRKRKASSSRCTPAGRIITTEGVARVADRNVRSSPTAIEPSLPTTAWLPALLQTADSLFPTGAYAHSGGLETLVALGVVRDAPTLSGFLRGRVAPMLGGYELPYLGFALAAADAGDVGELAELDQVFGAAKLPREARQASLQIGAQRLRMLGRVPPTTVSGVTPQDFVAAIARGEAEGHATIVCGLQAHRQGVPVEAAMTAYFYGSLSGYCSAALKLLRIGQEACQGVLSEGLALAEKTVAQALEVERQGAGWCDPGWEIAAARHERAFARLFIS